MSRRADDPAATKPSDTYERTKERNRKLDLEILRREPPDEITRVAPWYQRAWTTTLYSTVKSVIGFWRH
jgi:hypothetical protein